jgi:hypothetical protein
MFWIRKFSGVTVSSVARELNCLLHQNCRRLVIRHTGHSATYIDAPAKIEPCERDEKDGVVRRVGKISGKEKEMELRI